MDGLGNDCNLDVTQMLLEFEQTKAELNKFRKYSGAAMLQRENEQLKAASENVASEHAALVDRLDSAQSLIAELKSQVQRKGSQCAQEVKVTKHHTTVVKHRNKVATQQIKELKTICQAAAEYVATCSSERAQLIDDVLGLFKLVLCIR